MGSRGSGGAVGAGCGAFSLLGLLIGVGLTVWLGSQVFSATSGPASRRPAGMSDTTDPGSATTTTDPASAVIVTVDPATDLDEATTVTVSATGLEPETTTNVFTCLAGPSGPFAPDDRCDPASVEPVTADGAGAITVDYVPARVVTAEGLPFDCATAPGSCEIRVGTAPEVGAAPLTYRAHLGNPTVPGLGN